MTRHELTFVQLKFRVPSMLIRRDRLVSQQQQLAASQNIQALLALTSATTAAAVPAASASALGSLTSPASDSSAETSWAGPTATPTTAPPAAGYSLNPLQQWEALQKQSLDADRDELVTKASGDSGPYGTYVAQKMLHV